LVITESLSLICGRPVLLTGSALADGVPRIHRGLPLSASSRRLSRNAPRSATPAC